MVENSHRQGGWNSRDEAQGKLLSMAGMGGIRENKGKGRGRENVVGDASLNRGLL